MSDIPRVIQVRCLQWRLIIEVAFLVLGIVSGISDGLGVQALIQGVGWLLIANLCVRAYQIGTWKLASEIVDTYGERYYRPRRILGIIFAFIASMIMVGIITAVPNPWRYVVIVVILLGSAVGIFFDVRLICTMVRDAKLEKQIQRKQKDDQELIQ